MPRLRFERSALERTSVLAVGLLSLALNGTGLLAQTNGLLFIDQTNSFPAVRDGPLAWVEFNNDGRLDFLIS